MNKLKCFRCHHPFTYYQKDKWNGIKKKYEPTLHHNQVYRDEYGCPICEDCLMDTLNDEYEDGEQIFQWLHNYNYSFEKYKQSVFIIDCPNCESGIEIDKKNENESVTCWDCSAYILLEKQKVIKFYKNEDVYLEETENEMLN